MSRPLAIGLLLAANLACLGLVALVPASLWLGLADVAVPPSALAGFALVGAPAALCALALLGLLRPGSRLDRPQVRQLALFAALVIGVICGVGLVQMLREGRLDLAPFALGGLLLFALDAWVLLQAPAGRLRA